MPDSRMRASDSMTYTEGAAQTSVPCPEHRLFLKDSRSMPEVADASVHLVVTSPPYPMVPMWDAGFRSACPGVADALDAGRGMDAFEGMHVVLDATWSECARALVPGGFLCVNVGDAVRSVSGAFARYPNAARVTMAALRLGLTPLPDVLWTKPSNAPNKFMGSGTLPAGAYVTYEHEYVLIFRKGGLRTFVGEEAERRARSSIFWEERNRWFSDLWSDVRGTAQKMTGVGRERSGAYPREIPSRIILTHSIEGDAVLDPFCGTGTTMAAAHEACRRSVGYEVDASMAPVVRETMKSATVDGLSRTASRLRVHREFMVGREAKYVSAAYGFPVKTRAEVRARLPEPVELAETSPMSWTAIGGSTPWSLG